MTTNQVATIERQPRSVLVDMSTRYGMEPAAFEGTLRATVCKGSVSREEFAAFLLVAKEYGLNPLTKELYAFPAKGGGIQPIVSIDGWARIINDHPGFDGMEFEDVRDGSELIAITCRMFRKDRSHAIEATEYMAECKRTTDVWRTWPRRMLRHKALIQCARYAFGFSGIVDQDEYERQVEQVRQAPPVGLTARLQAANVAGEGFNAAQAEEPAHDAETGEIAEFVDAPAEFGHLTASADNRMTLDTPADRLRNIYQPRDDFPGDTPAADEPKPDLPPMKTGADLLAEKDAAPKPSLAERVAKFKASCAGAGTTKLMDAWRLSAVLRSDLDASDPEEVAALTDWWQAAFDAAEASEKGG